jgi:hypothetical protein
MPEIPAQVVAELFGVLNDRRRTPDEALVDVMTNADATNAARMQAARLLADASREDLVRAVTIKADTGTMTLRELQYLAAVFAVVSKWGAIITSPNKTLTDFMKIIPADDAALITEFLRVGR